MQIMFFWMLSPYDSAVSQTDWDTYLNFMAWVTVLVVLVTVAAIVGLYALSARRRRIRTPADLFRSYGCMWWTLLSIPAGIAGGIVAALNFASYCGEEATGTVPASISIGVETFLLCFVLGYLIILIPGITPPAFKYRPKEWIFHRKVTS
ncbi:MAG: hypothetical protein M1608_06590 [Candidatus Omnitrophica bacterium]|nr:hypothetical protein [Candidatus Omnitrophota bacterium]